MPRTGRPREFDEDAVVQAATELFWTNGYDATSVQDLVDGLGIQRGSIYGAFGDKRGLFLRALDRYITGVDAAFAALDGDGPVLPALRAVLMAALLSSPGDARRGCLLGNTAIELTAADQAAGEAVRTGFSHTEDAFRRALERAHESGELPDGDAGAQARMLLALLQGLQVIVRTERDPARLSDAVDAALAALT